VSDLPDSGKRQEFETGAIREDDPTKPAIEGASPFAMERLGSLFAKGGQKYGDFRNWEKGLPYMRFFAAILRHGYAWLRRDEAEDHMAAVMWNAQAIMHLEHTHPQLDDRPEWPGGPGITAAELAAATHQDQVRDWHLTVGGFPVIVSGSPGASVKLIKTAALKKAGKGGPREVDSNSWELRDANGAILNDGDDLRDEDNFFLDPPAGAGD
jgi:hypothetical protein